MIFETERLIVRKLILEDLQAFHELESNPIVLKYAEGKVKNFTENEKELKGLISKYKNQKNDFWIYAIKRKLSNDFIGTLVLVKDGVDDEIGYRFLEKCWGNGYATEICKGLISYCKTIGIPKIVGYVVNENIASEKILKRFNFKPIEYLMNEDIQLPETKYELIL